MNISHASCALHTGDLDHTAVSRHLDCNDGAAEQLLVTTITPPQSPQPQPAQGHRITGCQGQKLGWNDRLLLLMLGTWVREWVTTKRRRLVGGAGNKIKQNSDYCWEPPRPTSEACCCIQTKWQPAPRPAVDMSTIMLVLASYIGTGGRSVIRAPRM